MADHGVALPPPDLPLVHPRRRAAGRCRRCCPGSLSRRRRQHRKFRRERPGDSFRGWLRGITRNFTLLYFRRRNAQPQARGGSDAFERLHEVADTVDAPAEDDSPAELEGLHRRALELVRGQVEERTWQAFWLTTIEGQSPADVASTLGVSPITVRTAKSRVLRRLKEQFGELIH